MIPRSNTSGTITRPDSSVDGYEQGTPTVVASAVRAFRARATGADRVVNGTQELVDSFLYLNPGTDIASGDTWTDTYATERVVWTYEYPGSGTRWGHIKAGLARVRGVANG